MYFLQVLSCLMVCLVVSKVIKEILSIKRFPRGLVLVALVIVVVEFCGACMQRHQRWLKLP